MWLKIVLLVFGCSLSTAFDIGGVISGNRMAGVPLGRSLGDGEPDVEGVCAQSGMVCQNCTLAVTCVLLPGGWLKVPQETCGEGLSCNGHLGSCSDQHVPECDPETSQFQHTCEQVGIFPDAHDCRKFHLCSPPEEVPAGRPADHRAALCPRYYGFDPQTAQCSIWLKNGQCEQKPVPPCSKVGQTGVLPNGPNHYFVCLMKGGHLHPQVFICPHGWFFVDGFCRPEPGVAVATEPTEVATETTEVATESTEVAEKVPEASWRASFFSTEKPTTHKADTFLADKFNLANYETTDDEEQRVDDGSFESNEFW